MVSVFIVYEVPWLSCEPSDAYEDESAVKIHDVFTKKSEAKSFAKEYCNKYCKDGNHQIIKPLGKFDDQWSMWVSDDETEDFNEINGFAMLIVKKTVK